MRSENYKNGCQDCQVSRSFGSLQGEIPAEALREGPPDVTRCLGRRKEPLRPPPHGRQQPRHALRVHPGKPGAGRCHHVHLPRGPQGRGGNPRTRPGPETTRLASPIRDEQSSGDIRHGANESLRSGNFLHYVQQESCREIPHTDMYHYAVYAKGF